MAHSDGCQHALPSGGYILVPALVCVVGVSTGCIVPRSSLYPFYAAMVGIWRAGFKRGHELLAGHGPRVCLAPCEIYNGGGNHMGAIIDHFEY